ncbi:phenolic acid decarboxylase [Candidatus Arsenophonus nilaparvatae]|uniref:phenolic acid decarboxylase n=1 Tax=Candidatus Arsenophonus nilaparvatae TaxID=1247023 RepID=UPI003877EA0F
MKKQTEDLSGFIGTDFLYAYDNGWKYEWYARNHTTCDYRIYYGLVGGRWVTHQKMHAIKFASHVYKVDWHEPTGTSVSLLFDLKRELVHGTIFFPQWIAGEGQHPEKTICYQNEFIDDMLRFRDEGPAYPYVIISEFAKIVSMKNEGLDNDEVINKAPGQLPPCFCDEIKNAR